MRYVKTLSTSSFDSRLPRISLADFLSYETGSLQGKWAIVECEKQTVPARNYANQDFPTCVQAYQQAVFKMTEVVTCGSSRCWCLPKSADSKER
jgi:hypothetical protein